MTICVCNFRRISCYVINHDIWKKYQNWREHEGKITSTFCHEGSIHRRGDAFTVGEYAIRVQDIPQEVMIRIISIILKCNNKFNLLKNVHTYTHNFCTEVNFFFIEIFTYSIFRIYVSQKLKLM